MSDAAISLLKRVDCFVPLSMTAIKKGLLVSGKAFSISLYDYTLPALHGMTTMVMNGTMVIVAFISESNE